MNKVRLAFWKKNTVTEEELAPKQNESQISQLNENIVAALRNIYDPELPVNIYDLGLIYDININSRCEVIIQMTLTAPGCPVAGSLPAEVESTVKAVDGISNAHVELVWDPPWSQDNMSDEAKLTLG
ncbi:MAG: SUF system Fe-S cluster assembly protein, partial [Gammaproteobacteria bacterium]|nr:SUF system Fe-S cluster assembly protein [Gammaproteobacteria bacterium]